MRTVCWVPRELIGQPGRRLPIVPWRVLGKAMGFQLFGTQHAAALGDLQSASGDIPDVMGNYWSLGASIVVR